MDTKATQARGYGHTELLTNTTVRWALHKRDIPEMDFSLHQLIDRRSATSRFSAVLLQALRQRLGWLWVSIIGGSALKYRMQ